jgi:hypothetical protein
MIAKMVSKKVSILAERNDHYFMIRENKMKNLNDCKDASSIADNFAET